MAHIRTWEELQARELTPAEEQLIEACKKGEPCVLGGGELQPVGTPDPSRHIRADVLRYLILGGCDDCIVDDIGVWVIGAHVTGTLDLDFITTRGAIRMPNSRFEGRICCEQTKCRQLDLNGSDLQGLRDQAVKVTGTVFLRNITTQATIDLNSATIGGQLSCEKAVFEVEDGDALNAQGAKINGGLFWRGVTVTKGTLNFANAHTSVLCDDESSWPSGGYVDLSGMTYDTVIGGPLDAKTRLVWLDKGSNWGGKFTPQPYTQLAKVLREMGHDSDARSILLQRDLLLGPPNRARLKMIPDGTWKVAFLSLWFDITHPLRVIVDYMFRLIAGYGHRPFRSIPILLALIFVTIIPAHMAWDEGSFAPNSAIIKESEGWKEHQLESNPAKIWSDKGAAGNDWETFNRYAYGLDVVIPIINFGQTEAWAPSTNRGWWGKQFYWMRWVLGALGWIVTALGAAAITGVIRRN